MATTRYIKGQEYRRVERYPSKAQAQEKAKELRGEGKRIRVLPSNYTTIRNRRGYGGYRDVSEGWGVFVKDGMV